ncbi:MAG: bile acid:sodium symporter [Desulfobacterales bacterium]
MELVKKYWFLFGLAGAFAATILDPTGAVAGLGVVLKQHRGPDVVIFLIFLFSGMLLDPGLILCIVWMGISQALPVLSGNWSKMVWTGGLAALFHIMLLGCAFIAVYLFSVPRGRMESIIFMGSQKTLPLSIILQVTLFPQYGQALMVLVIHHLVSLFIDGFLVGRMGRARH